MSKSVVEIIVGFVVLFIATLSIFLAYRETGFFFSENDGYFINAKFDKVDGVNIGSQVKISGVSVGKVIEQSLDNESYLVVVKMKINEGIKLPIDTSAEIAGLGFMGDKYISISPGADSSYLKNDSFIEFTQSSISLESLISKFVFGSAAKDPVVDKHSNDEKVRDMRNLYNIPHDVDEAHIQG